MEIKLHANATTTPRIRRYLQNSDKSDRELAAELGISVTTVRRWRCREEVLDKKTTPAVIHKVMRQEQVSLVNALRDLSGAPLDELLLLVNDVLGIPVSRATLNRYLKPVAPKHRDAPLQGKKALKAGLLPHHLEVHHLLLSLHMDDGGEHHLLWAREPLSGWCFARLYAGISPQRVVNWLEELLSECPADIQSIETFLFEADNASVRSVLKLRGIEHKINPGSPVRAQVTVPLMTIIPRLQTESASQLLIQICDFYNAGRAQKKLGDKTPQAFLEALRHED